MADMDADNGDYDPTPAEFFEKKTVKIARKLGDTDGWAESADFVLTWTIDFKCERIRMGPAKFLKMQLMNEFKLNKNLVHIFAENDKVVAITKSKAAAEPIRKRAEELIADMKAVQIRLYIRGTSYCTKTKLQNIMRTFAKCTTQSCFLDCRTPQSTGMRASS